MIKKYCNQNKSFVYVLTLSTTGKKYVGRTKNPFQRKIQHINALKSGTHPNKRMQEDFNKGECEVVFEIAESDIPFEKRKRMEQLYMKALNTCDPRYGYNDNDPSSKNDLVFEPLEKFVVNQSIPTIGERVKYRREELGMSQTELAELVGLKSKASISKIETERGLTTVNQVIQFASILKCSPIWLACIEEES